MGYWRQMFNTAGESTTLAAMNAGTTATTGAYTPELDGTLKKVVVQIGYEAATSLVEDIRIEMTCTKWSPNTLHFFASGNGIRTAPADAQSPYEFIVGQPVSTNKGIDANYIHDSGVPVTSRIRVFGYFE